MAATSKRNARRGSAKTLGLKKSDNTSGLNAVWFQTRRRLGTTVGMRVNVYVCCACYEKRYAYSVRRHGRSGALMLAFAARVRAGLPVDTMADGLAALERYLKEEKTDDEL